MATISINLKDGSLEQPQVVIVGIDLDTTNSLVAYMKDGHPVCVKGKDGKSTLVPSIVHFAANEQIIVGDAAKEKLVADPANTIYSVKRLMGKSFNDVQGQQGHFGYQILDDDTESLVKIRVKDRFYTPVELSALILKELKTRIEDELGSTISKAVITVPAYFNDNQRQATRDAVGCAGEGEVPPVLTIGAVYGGAINDIGYNQALHDSIAVIAENIEGVEIIETESVATAALAKAAVQLMINQNATLMFSTAYDFYDVTKELADANPTVAFQWCGGGKNATANLGTFFGKPPDGWYLMGMAAALMMQASNVTNPTFGFVGAFPYLGWTRTFINAFTLCAQSVYPAVVPPAPSPVTVKVAYTYEWANVAKEVQVTNALIDQGAKVITLEESRFVGIVRNQDDEFIEKPQAALDDVEMPVSDGVERPGIYRQPLHAPLPMRDFG